MGQVSEIDSERLKADGRLNVEHCGSRQSSGCACMPLPKQEKPFLMLNVTAQPFDTDRLMEKSPSCSHLIIFCLTFNVTGKTSNKHGKKKKQQNILSPKFGFSILQVFILTNQPGPIYSLMKWQKT